MRTRSLLFPTAPFAMVVVMFAFSQRGGAQTGTLRLLIDPGDSYQYILDGRKEAPARQLTLPAGAHHFTFWAPARRVVDTTVTVEADRTIDLMLRLPLSSEFLAYRKDLNAWRGRRRLQRMLPVAVTLGMAVWTSTNYVSQAKAHQQLKDDLAIYERSVIPGAIGVLKEKTIPAHQADFQRKRSRFQVSAGITAICAAVTGFLYVRSAKDRLPEFLDQERIRFEGLGWVPGEDGGQFYGGFTCYLDNP